jgi:hypothetical protein
MLNKVFNFKSMMASLNEGIEYGVILSKLIGIQNTLNSITPDPKNTKAITFHKTIKKSIDDSVRLAKILKKIF